MAHKQIKFPLDTNKPQPVLRFGAEQFDTGDSFTILVLLALVIGALFLRIDKLNHFVPDNILATVPVQVAVKPVIVDESQTAELIERLKAGGLWELPEHGQIPMMIVNSYPADFHVFKDIGLRKRLFLHTLLPPALLARQEVTMERDRLQSILAKIDCPTGGVIFAGNANESSQCAWQTFLTADDINFVGQLTRTYRATSANELLARVNPLPASLILAQGALETSWGRSRFAREGNSIFGMWTWTTKGMVPAAREEGKSHKVKAYDSILDSIRAYQLTLNRLKPYEHLRALRLETDDSLILAEGLTLYSERGEDYVSDIKSVILSNNLQSYDHYTLQAFDGNGTLDGISKVIMTQQSSRASL